MARRWWLLGAALGMAAIGTATLAQAQFGEAYGQLLVRALESQLPPGSEIAYQSIEGDPMRLTATLKGVTARLGPAQGGEGRLTASEIQASGLTPDLSTVARIGTLNVSDLAFEATDGLKAGLGSVQIQDLSPLALPTLLQGRLDANVASGPITANRVSVSGGALKGSLSASRLAASRIDDGVATGFGIEGLAFSQGADRLGVERLDLASINWAGIDREAFWKVVGHFQELGREGASRRRPEAILTAIEGFVALGEAELKGLQITGASAATGGPEPGSTRLGRLSLGAVSRQGFGPLALDQLAVSSPEAVTTLKGLAYEVRIERFPFDELRTALATAPRTEAGVERLKAILQRAAARYDLKLASVESARPGGAAGMTLGEISGAGGGDAARASSSFGIGRFSISPAAFLDDPAQREGIKAAGLERITGRLASAWSSEAAQGRLNLDTFRFELDQLGAVELQARLQGADVPMLDPAQALASTSIAQARLVYTDRSLMGRLVKAWSGQGGMDPAMVADTLADAAAAPANTPWLDLASRKALADFLRRPGRIEIALAPKAPVPAIRLLQLVQGEPGKVASTLGLRITATPP